VFVNQGNDSYSSSTGGADTFFGGLGNDSASATTGSPIYFGNEGADTFNGFGNTSAMTVVGGNDSADGNDSIRTGDGADFILGNGGADSLNGQGGANTIVGGNGSDNITSFDGADLIFANENEDAVFSGNGADTVFGGIGNDSVHAGTDAGRDSLLGNEGNDTLHGSDGIDTVVGGPGNDVFRYDVGSEDGNNAGGGGPVEVLADLNWAEDRFQTFNTVNLATNFGAGTGATLAASANNAIAAAFALNGNTGNVAAQFTFSGRTYLAMDNQGGAGVLGQFDDPTDLLIDITGFTGTISTSRFIV
jgi:Ca2+-binding RTX toxin-like protein